MKFMEMRQFWRVLGLCCFGLGVVPLWAETWTLGDRVYENVVVREVNPETVVIRHQGGLGSLPLKSLPEALQERFGYKAEEALAHREEQERRAVVAQDRLKALEAKGAERRRSNQPSAKARMDAALSRLGQPFQLAERVDLRERFAEHGLHPRNQGRRPSCSVFAVSSAFEFALAENGQSSTLSEEYLIWATLQYLQRNPAKIEGQAFDGEEPGDIGFSLMSVVQAAQWYGAALQKEMPNLLGGSYALLEEPPEDLVERSRSRRLLRAARLTGENREQQIRHILQMLNEGWPVSIGMRWPSSYTLRERPLIDAQEPLPNYAHAVTLVGYFAPGGDLRNCVFIFRNSWGVRWGLAGHGMVSRNYLLQHLLDAIVIDVEPSA